MIETLLYYALYIVQICGAYYKLNYVYTDTGYYI